MLRHANEDEIFKHLPNCVILPTACCGALVKIIIISVLLLDGGTSAHSHFKIPINLD
jgi:hypothetical protein